MIDLVIRTVVFGDGQACVELEGVLDGRTSVELEQEVVELLERGPCRLAFDLSRLSVITSAGAGVFVGTVVMTQERGGAMALVRPQPAVRQVLEILGLGGVFPIVDDMEDAVLSIEHLCRVNRGSAAG
ncbi:MAG: STAS domain-containing protein [Planctomycetes bacterium]|nr:STAS domain-containing protein [Planctomycetota bacterium]